jgi:thioredoxin-like negative regulator of GroEL
MLQDINLDELEELVKSDKPTIVLAYTTMCGTCESAKRMLSIVSETKKDLSFCQINVNLHPKMIRQYDLTSVPGFLVYQNGVVIDQFYAFHSVTYLFERFKKL